MTTRIFSDRFRAVRRDRQRERMEERITTSGRKARKSVMSLSRSCARRPKPLNSEEMRAALGVAVGPIRRLKTRVIRQLGLRTILSVAQTRMRLLDREIEQKTMIRIDLTAQADHHERNMEHNFSPQVSIWERIAIHVPTVAIIGEGVYESIGLALFGGIPWGFVAAYSAGKLALIKYVAKFWQKDVPKQRKLFVTLGVTCAAIPVFYGIAVLRAQYMQRQHVQVDNGPVLFTLISSFIFIGAMVWEILVRPIRERQKVQEQAEHDEKVLARIREKEATAQLEVTALEEEKAALQQETYQAMDDAATALDLLEQEAAACQNEFLVTYHQMWASKGSGIDSEHYDGPLHTVVNDQDRSALNGFNPRQQ